MLDQPVASQRARLHGRPRLDFQEHLADLEANGLLPPHRSCRSTRTPSCIRWCAGNSSAACPEHKRRAFLFTNVTDAKGRRLRHAGGGRLDRGVGRNLFARHGRRVEDIGKPGCRRSPHPIPPIKGAQPRCQEVVITGDDLAAPGGLEAPAGAGLDARLRIPRPISRATFCVTRDPDSGIQNSGTYRAALKATDRLVVRMVARERRRRRLSALAEVSERRRADADRDRDRLRAGGACSRVRRSSPSTSTSSASPARSPGGRSRWRRRDRRSRRAGRRRDRDRGTDRSREARAGGAVRREQRLCRARSLQHADASDRDHPQARAGVHLDHQPGDAERIERGQEGRLRAAVPRHLRERSGSTACAAW